jgi:ubiquitin carboxyl-terminal hydrolase 1
MAVRVLRLRDAPLDLSDTASPNDTMPRGGGGLLSSMFGLNSESLLQRGVRGLTGALSSGPSNVPPGLGNISNSCYQNSVIQGLAALPSLHDYLSKLAIEHPSFTTETTNGALHDLISKLNNPANQGQNFWISGKLKSMSTFTQQDAQEYYSKILDELDTEVKKASSNKRRTSVSWLEATKSLSGLPAAGEDEKESKAGKAGKAGEAEQAPPITGQLKIVPNPLDGLIAQRVGCTSCGYSEGLSLITFNCITVSLGAAPGYNIHECLDEYTKLEYIDGVECPKCTLLKLKKTLTLLATANPASPFEAKLKAVSEMVDDEKFDDNSLVKSLNIPKKNWVQSSKSKQIVIARAPKSLVLHVNRSVFDERTGAQYKNLAAVSYPRILDLGNWCLGSSPSGSGQPDMSLEEWPRQPTQSMLRKPHERSITSPFQYRLRAAVTHYGSHGNGHYVCYRPHARVTTESQGDHKDNYEELMDEQWWRFSDESVRAIQQEQAHDGDVFMLFYERLDESSPSLPLEANRVAEMIPVTDDAPLPPGDIQGNLAADDGTAAAVPLPDDDDLFDLIPPESPVVEQLTIGHVVEGDIRSRALACSTPSPQDLHATPMEASGQDAETDLSEAESEDAPSTQLTSDSEAEPTSPPTPKPILRMPPHLMRTAGNAAVRGQENRQSLPLVSAT